MNINQQLINALTHHIHKILILEANSFVNERDLERLKVNDILVSISTSIPILKVIRRPVEKDSKIIVQVEILNDTKEFINYLGRPVRAFIGNQFEIDFEQLRALQVGKQESKDFKTQSIFQQRISGSEDLKDDTISQDRLYLDQVKDKIDNLKSPQEARLIINDLIKILQNSIDRYIHSPSYKTASAKTRKTVTDYKTMKFNLEELLNVRNEVIIRKLQTYYYNAQLAFANLRISPNF
jgi:hypothetical protein